MTPTILASADVGIGGVIFFSYFLAVLSIGWLAFVSRVTMHFSGRAGRWTDIVMLSVVCATMAVVSAEANLHLNLPTTELRMGTYIFAFVLIPSAVVVIRSRPVSKKPKRRPKHEPSKPKQPKRKVIIRPVNRLIEPTRPKIIVREKAKPVPV